MICGIIRYRSQSENNTIGPRINERFDQTPLFNKLEILLAGNLPKVWPLLLATACAAPTNRKVIRSSNCAVRVSGLQQAVRMIGAYPTSSNHQGTTANQSQLNEAPDDCQQTVRSMGCMLHSEPLRCTSGASTSRGITQEFYVALSVSTKAFCDPGWRQATPYWADCG
jgi:hypothetical protein